MASRAKDLLAATLISAHIPMASEIYMITSNSTDAFGSYWRDDFDNEYWFSGSTAFSSVTLKKASTGRHEVFMMGPQNFTLASCITWDCPYVHIVGAYQGARMKQRTRIGHSANFSPMLVHASSNSVLANTHWMYGRTGGATTNYSAMVLSGNRNSFFNNHWGGPYGSSEGDSTGFALVQLTGANENYFYQCTFGDDTIARSAANQLLDFSSVGNGNGKNIWQDCLFISKIDSSAAFMIRAMDQYAVHGINLFKNCDFIARMDANAKTMEELIESSAALATNGYLCFDAQCMTYGVDAITDSSGAAGVFWGNNSLYNSSGSTGGKIYLGKALNPATA
jgi:hypothetical protein